MPGAGKVLLGSSGPPIAVSMEVKKKNLITPAVVGGYCNFNYPVYTENLPAGCQAGDMVICNLLNPNAFSSSPSAGGWTQIGTTSYGIGYPCYMGYRILTAADIRAGSIDLTGVSSGNNYGAQIYVLRGVSSAAVISWNVTGSTPTFSGSFSAKSRSQAVFEAIIIQDRDPPPGGQNAFPTGATRPNTSWQTAWYSSITGDWTMGMWAVPTANFIDAATFTITNIDPSNVPRFNYLEFYP